ncbi:response regulator [Niveispirillum fermenti]|uniref:response regulator n=1 Tax=Niveispirillum fermenti TaxID=1233113 RepID=UPI003A865C51
MSVLETVLYVDDDPDLRAMAELALSGVGGMRVVLCDDGASAPALAHEHGVQLVLLDVLMPGMDGPATLKALRAYPVTVETPVIFVTACDQPEERSSLLALGAAGVMTKPLDLMGMAAEVRSLWAAFTSRTG